MPSGHEQSPGPAGGLRLAIAWFLLVSTVFYWRLAQERYGEALAIWHRVMSVIPW